MVRRLNKHRRDIKDKAETKAVAQHFMGTNSTAAYLQFIPVMVLRNQSMYARME